MALLNTHAGSWFGLPDFGITEKIQSIVSPNKNYTSQGGSSLFGQPSQVKGASTEYVPTTASNPINQFTGPVKPPGWQPTTFGGGSGAQAPVSQPVNTGNIQQQLDLGNNQIESDYNAYTDSLNAQESQYRGEAANAESSLNTQAQRAKTQLANDQAAKEASLQGYEDQSRQTTNSTIQQARDLYRQMQQQNIAQLSAQGLSSSSVAEALAERLGVETARRITTASQSMDDVMKNIAKEKSNLVSYVQTKSTEIDQDLQNQIGNIRNQLLSGIDAINRARNVASNERANRRQELLVNAQSAISQMQQQAQAYQQSMQAWAAQNTAKLNEVGQNLPGILSNFQQQMSGLNQTYGDQFTLAPQFNTDQNGNIVPTGVSVSKKKSNDPYEQLLSEAGVQ